MAPEFFLTQSEETNNMANTMRWRYGDTEPVMLPSTQRPSSRSATCSI